MKVSRPLFIGQPISIDYLEICGSHFAVLEALLHKGFLLLTYQLAVHKLITGELPATVDVLCFSFNQQKLLPILMRRLHPIKNAET